MNLNQVNYAGRLGSDPALRYTPGGTAVADVNIASTRKQGTGREATEETTWINVTFWGKDAENLARFFGKGDPIFVSGRLTVDEWEDRKTGDKRSKVKITCERWTFCGETSAPKGGYNVETQDEGDQDDDQGGRRRGGGGGERRRQEPRGRRTSAGREYDSPKDVQGAWDDDDDEDDIPF